MKYQGLGPKTVDRANRNTKLTVEIEKAAVKMGCEEYNSSKSRSDSQILAFDADTVVEMDMPDRAVMLSPWLLEESLNMVYAARGVGKTHFCLNVANAVATGGEFLFWKAPKPKRVLYIDGEMSIKSMQSRIKELNLPKGMGKNLRIFNPDLHLGLCPDLTCGTDQKRFEEQTDWADLIIIDNISTLCRGSSRKQTVWEYVESWITDLKHKGKSVLLVHHASRGGNSSGLSSIEIALDSIICLKHPKDHRPEDGARFIVNFEKTREGYGVSVASFEAYIDQDEDGIVWKTKEASDTRLARVLKLLEEGYNQTQIGELLGIKKWTTSRDVAKLRERGLYPQGPGGKTVPSGVRPPPDGLPAKFKDRGAYDQFCRLNDSDAELSDEETAELERAAMMYDAVA